MSEPGNQHRPPRALGFRDLILFYIVTGISLRWIATAATAGPAAVIMWLVGCAIFYVPLALTVMELSSRYPQEGGMYVWSKRAFGDFSGFMTGWTYWASNLPYFPGVLYFTASNALFITSGRWHHLADKPSYFVTFSLAALLFATLLNVLGLAFEKWLHNLGAIGTWAPIAILIGTGVTAWLKFGAASTFNSSTMIPSVHFRDLVFWSTIVFALGGSESASFLGDEIQQTSRNIPRALVIAGALVTSGYILGTTCVLLALPKSEITGLEGIMAAVSKSAARIGFGGIAPFAALLITLSNLGAVGAWLATSARIPFVAGIDHYLPESFARVHPKWGTPYVAVLWQAAFGILFTFLGQAGTTVKGAYDVLVSMGIISYFLPYLFTFAAMIRLQREPASPQVRRVPGGKPVAIVLGIVGFTSTMATILLSTVPAEDEPHKVFAVVKVVGLMILLVAAGALVYFLGRSRAAPHPSKNRPAVESK